MYKLINLTPHPITILAEDGEVLLNLAPADEPARVEEQAINHTAIGGIPMVELRPGPITGLPDAPEDGDMYVVSRPVMEAAVDQDYGHCLVVPYPLARDESGQVIGAYGFAARQAFWY